MRASLTKELTSRRIDWDGRLNRVKEEIPHLEEMSWNRALRDVDLFGRIMQDILKVDLGPTGKPGPRSSISQEDGGERLRELFEGNYSTKAFPEALRDLCGGDSYRKIAVKAGLERNLVDRMRRGVLEPDAFAMKAIATAYGRRPNWFMEYRQLVVAALIVERMWRFPDLSVSTYRKLLAAMGRADD